MSDGIVESAARSKGMVESAAHDDITRWEYRVIRVGVGPVAFQKYGPDKLAFEDTLNEWGRAGWEAFHIQAFADSEALLLFFKRRAPLTP
jgi:hypothetical protein